MSSPRSASRKTVKRNGQTFSNKSKANFNRLQNHPSRSSVKSSQTVPHQNYRIILGTHAVNEALLVNKKSIKLAYIQKNMTMSLETKELIQKLNSLNIKIEEKSDQDLMKFSNSHQGVVLFSDLNLEFDYKAAGEKPGSSLIVVVDGVEDAHNLGAIMRTSWLMGVSGLLIPADRAIGLTGTVHKVACGGVEHVPVTQINNFSEPMASLKEAGFWVYGLSHKANKSIYDIQFPEKAVIVLGAEDKGIRVTTERLCDELISIPQLSSNASYNVSVAAALSIAEVKRQWRK